MTEEAWYETLRGKWKPSRIRLLLIGESAPDDGGDPDNRRFFYSEPLSRSDNLFRSIVAALYDGSNLTKGDRKEPWLRRLRDDGVYLIDLAPHPVNAQSAKVRRQTLMQNVDNCVARCKQLSPDAIIICHTPTFALLSGPLRASGLPLVHDNPIPFPLGNKRAEFVEKVRAALGGIELESR